MSRILVSILIFLSCFCLSNCSLNTYTKFNRNLGQEVWMHMVGDSPGSWTRGTDAWFTSGRDDYNDFNTNVVTRLANVRYFSNIIVNGDFRVQIYGAKEDTIHIIGPAKAVATVVVKTNGNAVSLEQKRKAAPLARQVVIRIGVRQLSSLVQNGRGLVEGVRLHDHPLVVTSRGSGNIYLAGKLNPKLIQNGGSGNITLFGVRSYDLVIRSNGKGATNVSGHVGIKTIKHYGSGNINVLGASSDDLSIQATGRGKIGLTGHVRLTEVSAHDHAAIFVLGVNSGDLHVGAYGYSCVGLVGSVYNLNVEADQGAYVGARSLCADQVYVLTGGSAHANVTASKKVFAKASGSSSIYFYGRDEILSRFVSDNGFILRICTAGSNCPVVPCAPIMLKGAG